MQTVLAIDDTPEILLSVGNILKQYYQVYCAQDGTAALKTLVTYPIDLFVLDIDMPVMDGFTVAAAIREFEQYVKTPIVFLTGNASKKYAIRAIQSEASDFIGKPVNREALLTKAVVTS